MEYSQLSYEEALKELHIIMEKLESGKYTLNESMNMFKNAMELYTHCNDILIKTEGEVSVLLEVNGSLVENDFLKEEDDYY